MKIFVDENIPIKSTESLNELGHSVKDICETQDEGISDEKLWKIV